MLKTQIKPSVHYALRERGSKELQRVKILEHIRGNKWRAQWIDANPGLVHFVESGHLRAPWKDHKAFLREEAAAAALSTHNDRQGYKRDSPLDDAVCEISKALVRETLASGAASWLAFLRRSSEFGSARA
jgi:hypothetical protein